MGLCGKLAMDCCFITLQILRLIFAIPVIVLMYNVGGLAYYIVVVVLAAVGICLALIRTCCGFFFLFRWIAQFLMFCYILLEAAVLGWTIYFAYLFLTPFCQQGGWYENVPPYEGTGVTPSDDTLRSYYITGATFALLNGVMAAFLVCAAWSINKHNSDHSEKKKSEAPPVSNKPPEQEPLLQKSGGEVAGTSSAHKRSGAGQPSGAEQV